MSHVCPPERSLVYVISRYTHRTTFIVREIEALVARGWTITVISLRRPVFEQSGKKGELSYEVVYDSFASLRVLGAALGELVSRPRAIVDYARLVVSAFGFDIRSVARNLVIIPKACYYAARLRHGGHRHIHAHWATVSTSTAMLMARLSEMPYSFTGHAWDIFCDTRMLAEKGDAATFVLTCTAYNRHHLVDVAGVDAKKVHVLYHGLRLPPCENGYPHDSERPLQLLTVGRWTEKKGFFELIEALSIVRDQGVDFRLRMIVGSESASYERRVREAIRRLHLSDRIHIDAWVPSEEVEKAMRRSDLFVLPCIKPAHGGMDGIPNVLIEALSVGLPVVATRLSGIPELVRHRETGLLVNERDTRDLAAALAWSAAHRAEMRRFAAEGRRLVERAFDIDNTTSSLERHFAAAMGEVSPN